MRLSLVQFNPIVGDVHGNASAIRAWCEQASAAGSDLVVFPELSLTGYPPRDLLLQEGFLEAVRARAAWLAGPGGVDPRLCVMIGAPWKPAEGKVDGWDPQARTTNSVLVIRGGRVEVRYDKRLLPTYDVFDEDRYFAPGESPLVVDVAGVRVGVSVCEDLWRGFDAGSDKQYTQCPDPVEALVNAGAGLIVNLSASPFVLGKGRRQRDILTRHVGARKVAVAAVNQVGGNDDLVFDGHGAVFVPVSGGNARLVAAGEGFVEGLVHADLAADPRQWASLPAVPDPLLESSRESLLWRALVLGTRDYCRKTGFSRAVLGISGGIDSALVACIAVAALGPDGVVGVMLPGRFSSEGSVADARLLADGIGIRSLAIPIDGPHAGFEELLAPAFRELGASPERGITEENIQSRIRGTILMALSNKSGALLITTGNKSEVAVGYCTLYGDMNGGLAVLPDVSKVDVYRLSKWLNANHRACGFGRPPIPEASITKPPSAELRPNQTDQDSLPPYEVLDEILARYVEMRQSATRIVRESGIDEHTVRRVIRLIDVNEYKRKQMPVGLKVTTVTFGPGRRYPIAQGWRADQV